MSSQTPQERFNALYISSSEIERLLGVSRTAVLYARKHNILPEPIRIPGRNGFLWERDSVAPHLHAWRRSLEAKGRIA